MTGDPAMITGSVQESDLARVSRLARALTEVERGQPALAGCRSAGASVVGLVGPPGVGKSSVISALAALARQRGESVVVLAVDPSSPVTGGAVLGDRIRLHTHGSDPLVFVRSFASRGHPGGLAAAIPDAVQTALALGWDRVFVEPVGGGQNDIEIASCADIVLLVLSPESGDDVQALKAGILELADIIVVNKADRPGAQSFLRVLRSSVRGVGGATAPQCMLLSVPERSGLAELDEALRTDQPVRSRRDAAHIASITNELLALAQHALSDPAVRASVLDLIGAGRRAEAAQLVLRELVRG
jgi:LAO/AO transport system kinase